jgi:hypothetical protein
MRDPQMMRAIGEGRHLAGAAKLGCHLVHFTERPAAAGLVELDQRAGPHVQQRHDAIERR